MSDQTEDDAAAGLAEQTLEGTRQRLADLDGLPISEHVAVFDQLHRDLSAVLNSIDQQEDQGKS
ncbi:hypothetical protein CDO52_18940 [Nocardiopsis gilva YIM 90087]|uniref:Uncharacterized protein n=1 Tax=Nocardiopsis gilva YIM 90087 TaxID=1235441 RepID=A0A223S946_9ACTN|nr:hypothetical protein [Nocardiopsis gilva]ASU84602.1 hypothetical protein CDO52_18940 [Nocardiopsis gilva YIM 90087]